MAITEIVHDAQEGLKKLKTNYTRANAYVIEIIALHDDLEEQLNELDTNIKTFEQKFAGNLTDHQTKILLDGKARFSGLREVLTNFDQSCQRNRPKKPSDKFEEYTRKLTSMERACVAVSANEKDCIQQMEEIATYSNACVNFIDFYKKAKVTIESMIKILKEQNTTLKNSLTAANKKGWGEWIFDNFKSSLQVLPFTMMNSVIGVFTAQAVTRIFFS